MSEAEGAGGAPESRKEQTAPRGRFQPGQSGNPGGRPAVSKRIREMAQAHGEEAIAGLLALARDHEQPGPVRRGAWTDILDRGFGRPTVGEPDENGREVSEVRYTWGKPEGEGE